MDDYLVELDIWLNVPYLMGGLAGNAVVPELQQVVVDGWRERRAARERAKDVTERLFQTARSWQD